MTWVLLLTAAWLAVSLPLALVVCRSIRAADREAGGSHGRRPLSAVRSDGARHTTVPRVPASRRRAGHR